MIKQPTWASDSHPTTKGWVNSRGELIKSMKISQRQIDEWFDANSSKPKAKQTLHEAPVEEKEVTSVQKDWFWGS